MQKLGHTHIRPTGESGEVKDFACERIEIPQQPATPAEYRYHEGEMTHDTRQRINEMNARLRLYEQALGLAPGE